MYSEQLEQLIKSVIADGVITDKERTVLHKKAKAEGIDVDEIDVYVEGLIAKSNPQKPAITSHDFSLFDKIVHDGITYYQLKKFCKISALFRKPIKYLYLGFIDAVEDKGRTGSTKTDGLYLMVFGNFGDYSFINYEWRTKIILKTNIGTYQVEGMYYFIAVPNTNGQKLESVGLYTIDADVLKMLADASFINIIIKSKYIDEVLKFEHRDNSEKIELKEIHFNSPGLQKLAQCLYHELVDKTAYPDVTLPYVINSTNSSDNSTSLGEKMQLLREKQDALGEKMQLLWEKSKVFVEKIQEIKDKILNFYDSHQAFVIIAAIIILLLFFGKCK